MRSLVFNTQKDWDEWIANNELFDCFDKDFHKLGSIMGEDADFMESCGLASIDGAKRACFITKELDDFQKKLLDEKQLLRVIITEDYVRCTPYQKAILHKLRETFREAIKAKIMFCSNDDSENMYAFNFEHFDKLMNSEGDPEYYDNEKREWVKYSKEEAEKVIEIPEEMLEKIDEGVDFANWGCCCLPWRAHLKI